MEGKLYQVSSETDGGVEKRVIFTGNEYELKKRFPLGQFPVPLGDHRENNPCKDVTFYFSLYSSVGNNPWQIEATDPRLQ